MAASISGELHSIRLSIPAVPAGNADALLRIESSLPILNRPVSKTFFTRSHLLKQRVSSCHLGLFRKVLKLGPSDEKLEAIQTVRVLIHALKSGKDEQTVRAAFEHIPMRYRTQLCWAVWMLKGMPDVHDFGGKALHADIFLLNCCEPLLFLKEGNLPKQLLYRIEEEAAIEKQSKLVQDLETLSELVRRPLCDRAKICPLLESLPKQVQSAFHSDVYDLSAHRQDVDHWGKIELHRDPKCLTTLRKSNLPGSPTLVDFQISKHREILNTMIQSKELEAFERITVLYRTSSHEQIQQHLRLMPQSVSSRIAELERQEGLASQPSSSLSSPVPKTLRFLHESRGAHIGPDGTRFCVLAPNARQVTLLLAASGRVEHTIPMHKKENGEWEVTTPLAPHGRTYRYLVEDVKGIKRYRTDPFSFSTLKNHRGTVESRVTSLSRHTWRDHHWTHQKRLSDPLKKPLSIYELYAESWMKRGGRPISYAEMADKLAAYCKKMHFTHAQIYGILDNRGAWGHQVDNYFAPNRRLGTAEDFQGFVDTMHQNGIGVILGWVPAHYKHSPHCETLHEFDGTNLYSSGLSEWDTHLFDFSKPEVRDFLMSNALYWIETMHCDGINVDAVSHIVRRNKKRYEPGIQFLKELSLMIRERAPGTLILGEDTTGFHNSTVPVEKGGLGLDLIWGMDPGGKMRAFLHTPYEMRPKHHSDKFMSYLHGHPRGQKLFITHSHDASANRNGNGGYPKSQDRTLYKYQHSAHLPEKFADMRNFFCWQVLAPSRGSMLHMGDEIGQRRSWDVGIGSETGSVEWNLLDPKKNPDHALHSGLQSCISDLNKLYQDRPAFWKTGEAGFRLCCDHPGNNVIAYERSSPGEKKVFVVHNFSIGHWSSYDLQFGKADHLRALESLREIFNSNDPKYGGSGTHSNPSISITRRLDGTPVHMTIAIPPLSTMVFEEESISSPRIGSSSSSSSHD